MQDSESVATQTRSDPRIARSEAAIERALLEHLASGKQLNTLTVSEISATAGVTRKTFYARFGSLEQVVYRMVENLFTDMVISIDDEMLRIPPEDNALTLNILSACETHRTVLAPLISQCPAGAFIEPVTAVASRLLDRVIAINRAPRMDETERAYLIAIVASTLHGVLSVWTQRGFSEPATQVAAFTHTLLADGMQNAVLPNRIGHGH